MSEPMCPVHGTDYDPRCLLCDEAIVGKLLDDLQVPDQVIGVTEFEPEVVPTEALDRERDLLDARQRARILGPFVIPPTLPAVLKQVEVDWGARMMRSLVPFMKDHDHGAAVPIRLQDFGERGPCAWMICTRCQVAEAIHLGGCDSRVEIGLPRACVPPLLLVRGPK